MADMTAFEALTQLESQTGAAKTEYIANTVFLFIEAALVFSMQAGFAMLETGMTRSKNTSNIWLKNLMDFCVGTFFYFFIGFGLQYGDDFHGLWGSNGFGDPFAAQMGVWSSCVEMNQNPFVYFFFQLTFCGASATIISGAVAERMKFSAYLIISAVMSCLCYPIGSHWIWGGGWLQQLGIVDFAGTLAVHGIGGMAALTCAAITGPRVDKYNKDGSSNYIPGHSISLFGLGAIFLWFGWYGFNPGSAITVGPSVAWSAITTTITGGIGGLAGLFFSWIVEKKPNVVAAFNGSLAALVAVCSTTDYQSPLATMVIAIVAAIVVYSSSYFVDHKLHIDDPCGAGSLHFVSGIFGVLAAGIFTRTEDGMNVNGFGAGIDWKQLGIQCLGEISEFAWVFVVIGLTCVIIKHTMGIKMGDEEQRIGMDAAEHGVSAYDYVTDTQYM